MTWRLQIVHTTRYRYSAPVVQSYNEARLEPRSDRHQAVLSSRVEVEPSTRVVRHIDYWGSVVHHFDLQVPHQELGVVGRAVVETGAAPAEPGDAAWADLADEALRDQFEELLVPTPTVSWNGEITEVAASIRAASATPADAAVAAAAWVHDRLEYVPGSAFLEDLNRGGVAVPGPIYTNIVSRYDLIVVPYTSGVVDAPNVTNVVLQDECRFDSAGHLGMAIDPNITALVLRALDPAHAEPLRCKPFTTIGI